MSILVKTERLCLHRIKKADLVSLASCRLRSAVMTVLRQHLARINAGERVDHFETVRRRKDGTLIDIPLTISPIRSSDGTIIGASKIARDISERKRATERQTMLLREMHHRVKNLFAITGSIISLTARTAQTPRELADSMTNRLIALSRAHQLTLPSFSGEEGSPEKPTTFFTLLENLLSPFEDKDTGRWHLHGEDPHIRADRATSLARRGFASFTQFGIRS